MASSMHKFHGQWRQFPPSELVCGRWVPGQMLVYSLGGLHWRMALLQDKDPSYCQEFVLSSPESQIHEARLRQDVHITLSDGTTVIMDGLTPTKMSEIARLICQIQQQPHHQLTGDSSGSSSNGKFTYRDHALGGTCLVGFNQLSKEGSLTDVTLVAQGEEFRCHRALLAANSTYFNAMLCGQFVETNKDKITLSEISGSSMRSVLNYLYSGEVDITAETVQALFDAAHMLQLGNLEKACVTFMQHNMTDNNCIGVYFFAKSFSKIDLKAAAAERICNKFIKITKASEFLHLDGDQVTEILELDTVLQCTEEDIYTAALRWLEFDMPARQEHMYRVMKCIRFVHMDEGMFRERVKNRGIFRGCRLLQLLFEQVIYYMNHPYRWHELDLVMEPRRSKRVGCPPPRAVLYSAHDAAGNTRLHLYTPQRNTGSIITEWRNWPTECLAGPCIATLEAPSRGIFLAGGTQDGKLVMRLEPAVPSFSAAPATTCVWYKLTSLHHSRQQFSLVAVDRSLYAVGGCHKNTNLDSVEKFIAGRSQWVKVASLPCRIRGCCTVSFRGRLYVFGGESQTKKNRKRNLSPNVFCYDPETDRWNTLSPMKEGRALAGCAVYAGAVYVIGGVGRLCEGWMKGGNPSSGEVATCELYDPLTEQWRDGPPLPQPLASPGVIKYMGTIYVVGGMQSGQATRSVYRLGEAGDKWEPVTTDLYHPATTTTDIHSCYLPISLGHAPSHAASDSDSETTGGTSMEHFDMDSTSHSSDDDDDETGYPNASWDTESSSSGF